MRSRFLAIAIGGILPIAALAQSAPTNLRVDCGSGPTVAPENCTGNPTRVTYYWTSPSGHTHFEIEVNRGGATEPGWGGIWYWDSGSCNVPQAAGATQSVQHLSDPDGSGPCAAAKEAPYKGAQRVWWRVRISSDGSTWSPWAVSSFRTNVHPDPPASFVFSAGDGSGSRVSYATPRGDRIWVDSVNGADGSSCGTQSSPCASVAGSNGALKKVNEAGDRITVRGGSTIGGWDSGTTTVHGTQSNPVVIDWDGNGQRPRVTSRVNLNRRFWVVDGFRFTNASGNSVSISAGNTMVKNCEFFGSTGAERISVNGNPQDVSIVGNVFNRPNDGNCAGKVDINAGAVGNLMVRGNEFTGCAERALNRGGVQANSGQTYFIENWVHDYGYSWPLAVSLYYGTGYYTIARNLFEIAGPRVQRGAWGDMYNNTCTAGPGCIRPDDVGGVNNTFRNNVCSGTAMCMNWSLGVWSQSLKMITDHNNHAVGNPNGLTNCPSCVDTSLGNEGSVPHGLDGSWKPDAASDWVVDAGMDVTAAPVGGGAQVDAGRFEHGFGALAIDRDADGIDDPVDAYAFQPRAAVTSLTPKIEWVFEDQNIESYKGLEGGGADSQHAYQVQIDTVSTFDSQGEFRPLLDSGEVVSSSTLYHVPAGVLADGGRYYFRVRTKDSIEPNAWGAWSDPAHAFLVDTGGGGGGGGTPPPDVTNVVRTDVK